MLAGSGHGYIAAQPPAAALLADHPRGAAGPWQVRGRLASTPRPAGTAWRVDLEVDRIKVDGVWRWAPLRVRTTVYDGGESTGWTAGRGFEGFLALRPHRGARNPLVGQRAPLIAEGADVRSSLKSFRQLRSRSPAPKLSVATAGTRARIRAAIRRHFPHRAPLMKALLLGERDDVPPLLSSALARTGLIHLFAISGLHVGIVVATLFGGLRLVGFSRPGAALLAAAALPLLYVVVVPRPPVARACWMAAALLAGVATGRRTTAINGLALATLVLSATDPWVTRNFGFQLSTAATAAILALAPPRAPGRHPLLGWITTLLIVSAAAQLAVAPLLLPTTFRLPLVAIGGNVIAVPLLSAVVVTGICTVAAQLAHLETAATGSAFVGSVALSALLRLTELVDVRWAVQTIPAAAAPWAGAAAIATLCSAGLALPRSTRGGAPRRRHLAAATLAAAAVTTAAVGSAARPASPPGAEYRLVAFDVGQGDALLLESGGATLLIDTGGSLFGDFDPGSALIAPALRARGISALDAVLISHLHADHVGGLAGLLAEVESGSVWTAPFDAAAAAGMRFEAALGAVPAITLARGAHPRLGGCRGAVVHPPAADRDAGLSNDGSLVVAWRCGRRTLLLTGDTESAAEAAYTAELALPAGTVLKSPHHGSRTSSSTPLLAATASRHAVISVGWRNRFGLPDAEILERYRRRRIAVYRTDRDGAVTLTAGRRVRVTGERWTSGRGRRVVGGWLY